MGVMPVKSINGKKFKLDNEIFGNISSLYKRFFKNLKNHLQNKNTPPFDGGVFFNDS
jgi:hypothetical protein